MQFSQFCTKTARFYSKTANLAYALQCKNRIGLKLQQKTAKNHNYRVVLKMCGRAAFTQQKFTAPQCNAEQPHASQLQFFSLIEVWDTF